MANVPPVLKAPENNFNNQTEEIVFINNAGIIDPIDKVGKIDDHSIIKSNFVNFLSSIRIANKLKIGYKDARTKTKR